MGRLAGAALGFLVSPLIAVGGTLLGAGIIVGGVLVGSCVITGSVLSVVWAPVVGASMSPGDIAKLRQSLEKIASDKGLKLDIDLQAELDKMAAKAEARATPATPVGVQA